MWKPLLLAVSASLITFAGAAWGAPPVLTGEVCDSRVHELTTQIEWNRDLHKAESEAKAQGKLIFWMHILGRIDGAT